MFLVRLVWEESLRIFREEGKVVIFCEVKVIVLKVLYRFCDFTRVYQLVDVRGNLLITFEVGHAVYQL